MPELHLDVESRSTVDLPKAGLYPYWEHEHTDLWCASFAVDDEPVQQWRPGQPPPAAIVQAVAEDWLVFGHNVSFERCAWEFRLGPKYGWPVPKRTNLRCTAAMAAAMALPRDLGGAANAMGLDQEKDQAGKRLMMQMARPRRLLPDGTPVWWEDEAKLERLAAYCDQDVEVERALTKRLRPLSDAEFEIFLLDMEINERGVRVDTASIKHAKAIVSATMDTLDREIGILTRQAVTRATQAARLGDWLREQGVDVESVDKAAVKAALSSELTDTTRRVLEIRQEAAKSSTAKLDAMLKRSSADGRARENAMYHGASTGRWSGKGIQLQNLPRPSLKGKDVAAAIEAMKTKDPAWLELWGPPLSVVSDCLRGLIVADEGHELVRADFANIEGRVLAWLAGQEDKLEAFRAYDRKEGPDLYIVTASGMYGVPVSAIDRDDPRRQVGKVSELACGFGGGHGAFISMGKNYGLTPGDIAPAVRGAFSDDRWDTTAEGYDPKNRYDLGVEEWTALRIVVDAWRAANPEIVALWGALDAAAMDAVKNPGRMVSAGRVAYACQGNVLWCKLPSGRMLAYVDAKIRDVETPWGSTRPAVTYMGVNSVTRKWERHKGYGGHFAENVTQAVARDVMAEAMLRIEGRGWPVVLTVHDEIVSEVPAGSVSVAEYVAEMETLPCWARGLPVTAEGVVGRRYGK